MQVKLSPASKRQASGHEKIVLVLCSAVLLAACKGDGRKPDEPLAPFLTGYWLPGEKKADCSNGAVRFGKQQIYMRRKGVDVPVMDVVKANIRGGSLDLTLKMSELALAMMSRSRAKQDEAGATTLYVSLYSDGERVSLSDIQFEDAKRGLHIPPPRQMEGARRMFAMTRCPV